MVFLIKKFFFKLMELGLGLKPCFLLETKNPIFINFKLSKEEQNLVQSALPSGFRLSPIAFTREDREPHYWLSYNLYEIRYPKKELSHIRKVRCEINTFVTDQMGRTGIYVFCGSPLVSRESRWDPISVIVDLAERLVQWIYSVGKLVPLAFELGENTLSVAYESKEHSMQLSVPLHQSNQLCQLSDDYLRFNDISFFNRGKTFDLVNSNSVFALARFESVPSSELLPFKMRGPFFDRNPDQVLFYRGAISYLVSALNKTPRECFL